MTSADFILRKALVAADIPSRDWSLIHAGLRNRAFFMSRVTNERVLYAARQSVREMLEKGKSASEIRRDVRRLIRPADRPSDPKDVGTIKDINTKRRLDVMIEQNVRQARGYANHLSATSEGALRAFPGYELVRVRRAKMPRDWDRLWKEAARKVGYAGVNRETNEKIALKTSPVWVALSKFGNPFPPFDWGSGMGLDDVPRSKCAALGLVGENIEEQKPPKLDLNGHLEVEIPLTRDDSLCAEALRRSFGDQVRIKGDRAVWRGNLIQDVVAGRERRVSLGEGYDGRNLSISHAIIRDHISKHIGAAERERRNIPLTADDFEFLPIMWRKPSRVLKGKGNSDVLELETLDDAYLYAVVDRDGIGIRTFYKTRHRREPGLDTRDAAGQQPAGPAVGQVK